MYHDRLSGLNDITLPPGPDDDPRHFDVYQNYEIESGHRDELREFLSSRDIGTLIQWAGTPVHTFHELGFDETLPATEKFLERCFMLPMHTALSNEDVDRICNTIHEFYTSRI